MLILRRFPIYLMHLIMILVICSLVDNLGLNLHFLKPVWLDRINGVCNDITLISLVTPLRLVGMGL